MKQLKAAILLAGTVHANALRRAVGRFVLELPIDSGRCVMDSWHAHLLSLAQRLNLDRLSVRVIVDRTTPTPAANRWNGRCEVSFEQDPFEFRGTGGLLCDLARQYEDDDYLLVINAPQVLYEPLAILTESLGHLAADVALLRQPDGTPGGVMLLRCGALRAIPRVGFVDLNEQALPLIARAHDVRICNYANPTGLAIRTLTGYLEAVREYHRRLSGRGDAGDPTAEDWAATFSLIEPGAQVSASAVVHDSIVLSGAKVDDQALLVRAVVCPGAHVSARQSAIDRLVPSFAAAERRP
ncbi:MAG: hypothetical protein IT445_16625 [Phycisphaeraceae bacterium]|nr:hypothetical protein [Phycisphaeraceae bacterium]